MLDVPYNLLNRTEPYPVVAYSSLYIYVYHEVLFDFKYSKQVNLSQCSTAAEPRTRTTPWQGGAGVNVPSS